MKAILMLLMVVVMAAQAENATYYKVYGSGWIGGKETAHAGTFTMSGNNKTNLATVNFKEYANETSSCSRPGPGCAVVAQVFLGSGTNKQTIKFTDQSVTFAGEGYFQVKGVKYPTHVEVTARAGGTAAGHLTIKCTDAAGKSYEANGDVTYPPGITITPIQ